MVMKTHKKLLLILLSLLALLIGAGMQGVNKRPSRSENALMAAHPMGNEVIVSARRPLPHAGAFGNSSATSAGLKEYLFASQGLEVQFTGLSWNGMTVDLDSIPAGGFLNLQSNSIHFDPDLPNRGFPDLFVTVNNIPVIYHTSPVSRLFNGVNTKGTAYRTYEFLTAEGKAVKMDLWLMAFDMTFRVDASAKSRVYSDRKRRDLPMNEFIPRDTRRPEFRGPSYENLEVLFRVIPGKDLWLMADGSGDGYKTLPEHPEMAIAAIECIEIEKVTDEKLIPESSGLGIDLSRGQLLPLTIDAPTDFDVSDEEGGLMLNPGFFNQPVATGIRIHNLRIRRAGKPFLGARARYVGDAFHVRFLIHVYVVGDWVIQGGAFADYEPRGPQVVSSPGLLDYVLPDFHLGFFGKFISSALILLILVLTLGLFFPSMIELLNMAIRKLFIRKK